MYEVAYKCNRVHIKKPTEYKSLCYIKKKKQLLVHELQISSANGFLPPNHGLPTWKCPITLIFIIFYACKMLN